MCGVEPHATPEWLKIHFKGGLRNVQEGGRRVGGGGVSAGLPSDGHKEDWVRERVQRIDALQCGG